MTDPYSIRCLCKEIHIYLTTDGVMEIFKVIKTNVKHKVCRTYNSVARSNTILPLPCLHFIDNKLMRADNFIIGQVIGNKVVVRFFVINITWNDALFSHNR